MVQADDRSRQLLFGAAQLKEFAFWKVQAIGNDFPVVRLEDADPVWLPYLAVKMSDRRFGIGGDGLLAVGMKGDVLILRMFNPDGTEDFCGNGLRAAAMLASHFGWVAGDFLIEHLGRVVEASLSDGQISVKIGKASYDPKLVPVCFADHPESGFHRKIIEKGGKEYFGSSLTTGSTHTVMKPGIPPEGEFQEISREIENSPQFPARTSVIWREPEGQNSVRIRIWERGVGETLGCGTGSAAAAVEMMRERGFGGKVQVHSAGGSVEASADSWDSDVTITGTAEIVYTGTYKTTGPDESGPVVFLLDKKG